MIAGRGGITRREWDVPLPAVVTPSKTGLVE